MNILMWLTEKDRRRSTDEENNQISSHKKPATKNTTNQTRAGNNKRREGLIGAWHPHASRLILKHRAAYRNAHVAHARSSILLQHARFPSTRLYSRHSFNKTPGASRAQTRHGTDMVLQDCLRMHPLCSPQLLKRSCSLS